MAGARVLANSGMTSDTGASAPAAEVLARAVATQVATQNEVGGRNLVNTEVTVTFGPNTYDPLVTVRVGRTDLPTFFARIWGRTQIAVAATATAEAYNPSRVVTAGGAVRPPVAPTCVKPWLLPNMDPSLAIATPANRIFDPTTGAIQNPALLGWEVPTGAGQNRLSAACTDCAFSAPAPSPSPWKYYPATTDSATGDFPAPAATSVVCPPDCVGLTPYQLSVAGCVQTPISCSTPVAAPVHVDVAPYSTRDSETATAINGMTHASANRGDKVDLTVLRTHHSNFSREMTIL